MAITDWPADERPREKLLQRGANALSDAELLAIFLRTGCSGKSAVDLARDLLSSFGSLRTLLGANQQQFCQAHGLGVAKYTQLQAVLEMSRRYLAEPLTETDCFTSTEQVKEYLKSQLQHRQSEVFAVLFLNSQHHLISFETLFFGSIDSAAVYPREIVKHALTLNAAAVILAHNHPSGISQPSNADREITSSIQKALSLLDIRTLDHFIVGHGSIFSFAEHGLI